MRLVQGQIIHPPIPAHYPARIDGFYLLTLSGSQPHLDGLKQRCVVAWLDADEVAQVQLLKPLQMRAIGREAILHHQELEARVILAQLPRTKRWAALRSQSFLRSVWAGDGRCRHRQHRFERRMHQHRPEQLMVVALPALAGLHTALRRAESRRRRTGLCHRAVSR
jgi:hypothetical protein